MWRVFKEREMTLPPKDSPIWGLMYLVVIASILFVNATTFDQTEIVALIETALVIGGIEYKRHKL